MSHVLLATPRILYRRFRTALAWRQVDALLTSYPKSGRTWFRFILASYLKMVVTPDEPADLHNMFTAVPNLAWDPERGIPAFDRRRFAGMPLIAVSHEYPKGLLAALCPIIYMVRDPRDVMVSAYYHATRHKHRYDGDIDHFVRDPKVGLATLVCHLNKWSAALADHPHLILHYEELSANPEDVVKGALRFLGIEHDEALVRRAIDAASFGKMRELEVKRGLPGHEYDRSDPQALRTRRGAVGGFVDELSETTAEWILAEFRARLAPDALDLFCPEWPVLGARNAPAQCGADSR
jgi:alcohol sulfotransferase